MFLTWSDKDCPANYVFKGDDDIFINPFLLEDFTSKENATVPAVYGCQLGGQPPERKPGSRYADFKWPESIYPKYISGGGFLMNRAAAAVLRTQIPLTPVITIDDALIGIAMARAGHPGFGFPRRPETLVFTSKNRRPTYFHFFD